jgi:outer membrane protein OmpA-like peptidoglycan-associated protein
MRLALVVLIFALSGPLQAQQEPGDPGPPYQLKVLDLLFRVDDIGGRVEDLVVKESETDVRVELAADVLFEFDKAELLPIAEETLTRAAAFVKERSKGGVIRIEGHTDGKGSASYNKNLSLRRAESVKKWLVSHGLSGMQFSSDGFGADKPVAPNTKPDGSDDPEGRRKNRRVEIVIKK